MTIRNDDEAHRISQEVGKAASAAVNRCLIALDGADGATISDAVLTIEQLKASIDNIFNEWLDEISFR